MQPITITPSGEKGSVSVTIGETTKLSLTTEEVDALLLRLAEVRPMLLPQPPLPPEPTLPRELVVQAPRFYVHTHLHPLGGVLLHLPHPAVGWMTWHLPSDMVLALIQTLGLWRVPPGLQG